MKKSSSDFWAVVAFIFIGFPALIGAFLSLFFWVIVAAVGIGAYYFGGWQAVGVCAVGLVVLFGLRVIKTMFFRR